MSLSAAALVGRKSSKAWSWLDSPNSMSERGEMNVGPGSKNEADVPDKPAGGLLGFLSAPSLSREVANWTQVSQHFVGDYVKSEYLVGKSWTEKPSQAVGQPHLAKLETQVDHVIVGFVLVDCILCGHACRLQVLFIVRNGLIGLSCGPGRIGRWFFLCA